MAPAAAEKLPAAQFEQNEVPVAPWNVPATQAVQLPMAAAEEEPAAHAEQAPAPVLDLYKPALQFEQVEAPVAAW